MEEEWRAIVGYEGYYEVSNRGNVRSLDRTITNSRGTVYNLPGILLKPTVMNKQGHLRVFLCRDGLVKKVGVHQLVARAFIANPEGYPLVRHWDDNPANNDVENLLWGNHRMNALDSVRLGNNNNATKTHCPNNHAYDEENTFNNSAKKISRACRKCKRDRDKAYHTEKMKDPAYREMWNERSRQQRKRIKELRRVA